MPDIGLITENKMSEEDNIWAYNLVEKINEKNK